DTRLLRGTVAQMVGKIAHPLNRARFDPDTQRVTGGYGILQPRVSPSLPGQDRSIYQGLFSSPGGIEPYAAAASDLYQDLFGEGTFTGKGIYDVDAFEAALQGRVSENTLLSHDLFEGVFARAGLASDIEVVEDYPARYDVDIRRQHRWTRGDWQLLPWIFGTRRQDRGGLPTLGRWKMLDNLRRSLLAPFMVASLFAGWMLPWPQALSWTLLTVTMLGLPRLLSLPFGFFPARAGVTLSSHFAALRSDTLTALGQIAVSLTLLADTAATMLDAVVRTIWRLRVSRRNLLEWMTAAQVGGNALPSLPQQYIAMSPGLALGLAASGVAWTLNPEVWPLPLAFGLAWLLAPAVSRAISLPRKVTAISSLTALQAQELRLIGRRTWRYFETFVTPEENFLPPDNFQETPRPVVATRTSPTNIGLYLLSTVAAHDMGWIGQRAALQRMLDTLHTIQRMPRFRGHLYNWHDTRDLRVLEPAYVSSVDSGNLAGHLIAVAQACRAWASEPVRDDRVVRQAMADCALIAKRSLGSHAEDMDLVRALADVTALAADPGNPLASLTVPMETALAMTGGALSEAKVWTTAMQTALTDHLADLANPPEPTLLQEVEALCRILALEMDFNFLLEPDKKLLSIGFSVSSNRLDTNCYDLLASEARLASLFAIAKGDVETRHWFRLGRPATPIGSGSALISWSGSMFEYLMPSLVMRAPTGSVLEQTTRLIVSRQQGYAAALGIPWGISESSYNARDLEMTYQYSNFGVPGLGLKRGLSENRVIAPYATGLAAMVDPVAAVENYARLAALGAEGRFGFYEAVDFTPARLPSNEQQAIVRSFMAHHQGMTIVAIANTLQDGRLRDRFHAEPMIQGAELLLQERIPRDVGSAPPRATEVLVAPVEQVDAPAVRTFEGHATELPTSHLLSNGNYGVMLTPAGEGFSRWREMAVTRWRDEAAQAALGAFVFLRDRDRGEFWSSGVQPTRSAADLRRAVFCEHHAAFTHRTARLTTTTEVVVSAEDDAEARRVTLTNSGRQARNIDVTSYAELVLAPPAADQAHPAFSKMFVVTDYLPELGVIIATRRRRSPHDPEVWAAHIAVVEGEETAPIQFETDRARFIGRGRTIATAAAVDQPLSGTTGTVLDPIFSIRRSVRVPAGGTARVTFWTMVADTPDALLDLVDRHRDASAFARAATLAWTQAQVQLRHLGITHADAADYQTLGGMVMRNDARLRARPAQIIAGAAPQSALWSLGISGDLPIVLLQIDDIEDISVLHEAIRAHEYWQMRQLAVDLVVLNDRTSSYVQDLQIAIDAAVRSARSRPQAPGIHAPAKGTIHALRTDLLHGGARAHLFAAARVILVASQGDLASQLARISSLPVTETLVPPAPVLTAPSPRLDLPQLEFFNGTGGFARDGREYVTILQAGQTTPAPWINVISNPTFGFQVSAEGSGHVWSENSRENQLTPWSNDPVTDPPGEALYVQDVETGRIWTPTALPVRDGGTYVARHGFGYSRFQHAAEGIDADMVQFVPLDAPAKISRLTLRNTGTTTRTLSVTAYAEWVLGTSRGATAPYIVTHPDPETGAILAQNTFSTAFPGRIAFADFGNGVSSFTADRVEFFGVAGSLDFPAGLRTTRLSGRTGPALDPCAALQRRVTLPPGETVSLTFLIGQSDSASEASALIQRLRAADADALLAEVEDHWSALLGTVQVTSPDRAMDILLNGWLMYQTLACRIWARAGFYQASGAYGFRDQLQDGMALTFARPEMTRAHLLRAASRQFPEGDVQHWWLPHSGQGVRTRISDDRIWLGYGVARYVAVSGDAKILDEDLPFLSGPPVPDGAHDDFAQPQQSDETASLFEHCARGLDQAIQLTGDNGMPLIGTGDWNDGMNRVGEGGKGTSVWLGWLLIATIDLLAPLADARDPGRAARWRAHRKSLLLAIETNGWDGEWYRRGTFDDGTLLGSASSDECRIDSIAQSWAVLSQAANPDRARQAMASMTAHLVRPDPGLALLFAPPFDRTPLDPGYIKGYPPGLRENGGQYSHAAMWAVLAQAKLGDGDAAHALFAMLNPINHALNPADTDRYKVEPYVVAADVYSTPPHSGRGGWTWYTGSAGWMYRAGIEGIVGLTRKGDRLSLNPCLPSSWPELTVRIALGKARYAISIRNPDGAMNGILSADLDGTPMSPSVGGLDFPLENGDHELTIVLGTAVGMNQ
ncbi:MAG: glucoamylase family protein, partial [Pseudomonadota bacterium]